MPRPRSGDGNSRAFDGTEETSRSLPAPDPAPRCGWRSTGRARLRVLPRRLAFHLADAFERSDPLAADGLELDPEIGRVVGDQFRPVARPADFHVKGFLLLFGVQF